MQDFAHIRQTVESIDEDVVTLYLHVDPGYQPNQSTPRGWEIYMKSALNEIASKHIDNADDNASWQGIRERIELFVRDYNPSGGQSLVIFAGEDTFHTHEIRVQLDNNHAYGDPMIVPLLWAVDEHEEYLVVLVDSEQARLMNVYLGRATVNNEIDIDIQAYDFRERNYRNRRGNAYDGVQGQGSGKDQYEDMKDEHIKRFYRNVADKLQEAAKDADASRLIIGGDKQAAHAFQEQLHQAQQDMFVGILPMRVDSDNHEVVKHIREMALDYEREQEQELVEQVIGFAKADGRGALGEEAVSRAFEMQQVELLVMPFPPKDEALAAEYTLRAMKSGAQVELVHGKPAAHLREEGGEIAARLYYYIDDSATESEEAEPSNS